MLANQGTAKTGEKIRQLRKYLQLAQRQFGERIGCTSTQISKFESGAYGIDQTVIHRICTAFHVNSDYFENDDMKPQQAVSKSCSDGLSKGERLKMLRTSAGLTQNRLAAESGVSQTNIAFLEKGATDLNLKTAGKLGEALHVGAEYLVSGDLKYKNNPVSQTLIDWLWDHEEIRKKLWDEMEKERNSRCLTTRSIQR